MTIRDEIKEIKRSVGEKEHRQRILRFELNSLDEEIENLEERLHSLEHEKEKGFH